MKDSETRRYEMFSRVKEYGESHSAEFPAGTYARELFTNLNQIIPQLDQRASEQSAGMRATRESSTSKAVARDELVRDLEAISRTARTLALTTPGLEDKFRAPRNLKDQELLTLARSFASEALPFKADFIQMGLPERFLDDLDADIAEFEVAIRHKLQGTETHVTATAAIDDLIESGMRIVRQLDTIIRNTYADNPAEFAAWLSASHVERVPRSATKPQAPQTPASS